MLKRQTTSALYWTESLDITQADIDYLFSVMFESEKPLSSLALANLIIERHLALEEKLWQERLAEGVLFQPGQQYALNQKLVFSALDFALGEVVGTRPGRSPEYGEFVVLKVKFEDGVMREFASELSVPHALDLNGDTQSPQALLEPVDANQILEDYGDVIIAELEMRLQEFDDVAYAAGLWFLKSLMPNLNEGHINLAEAMLDMSGGGPLPTDEILGVLDLPKEVNLELQRFAVDYMLYEDKRFDEVGPAGLVRWYLRRLEPEEVRQVPPLIAYDPVPYAESMLSAEARSLQAEIRDELSTLPVPKAVPEMVTLTLIYPHRRAGTLPLNAELSALFPTSLESRRIRITLVDGKSGEEFEGWVVREARYVYGLDRFYRTHRLPIGVYIHIRRTEDPTRFVVDFDGYRARTEWIRLVVPQNGRITFQNHRRSIGAAYDDLMVLGADDLARVDEITETARRQRRSLIDIIRELLPELSRLNPQGTTHAKTLYSAINVIRRCPPGPVLAALESQPEFEYVGDHYWQMG